MHKKMPSLCLSAFAVSFSVLAADVEVSFDRISTRLPDGTRAAAVRIGKVKSFLPDGSTAVRGSAVTPDGRYVLFTHGFSRYRLPATQLDRGWICSAALSVRDAHTGKHINTVMLDDALKGAANPWGVAVNDRWIAVTHSGTHEISVIDAPAFFRRLSAAKGDLSADFGFLSGIRRRIPFRGKGPRDVSFRPDGRIEVRLHFAETCAVVDPVTGEVWEHSPESGVSEAVAADPTRLGELYFNDATLCYQSWLSCASCHVDGGNDGLFWDFPGSSGKLGDPLETVDLRTIEALKPTCVKDSFLGDHLFVAPPEIVKPTEAYIRSIIGGKRTCDIITP